jgi:hypothetical protein
VPADAPAHLKRAGLAEPRGPRRRPDGRWVRAVGGLAVVGLMAAGVVAIASRVIEEAEPIATPEPRVAFAQASHRLSAAGSFAYHGSAETAAASPVRPGLWLASDVSIEGEVDLPARSREVSVDDSGRAAEAVTVGPTVWGRSAAGRHELEAQPLTVVSEGPGVMGAALMLGWLAATTERHRDGVDDDGRPTFVGSLTTGPTDGRPDQPSVEGELVLVLDRNGDPASVEIDGTSAGVPIHLRLIISGIGDEVVIAAPGGRELGVTGPVTPNQAVAAGISHPVQLGRVPDGWVLMRMDLKADSPSRGCSTLRLEYRDVDSAEAPDRDYYDDNTITLLVTSPDCGAVRELPNFHFDEAFNAGRFSGFVATSRSFKSLDGIVTDGDTTVQFATDLAIDDARTILESLGPFDPATHPVPVALTSSAPMISRRE